MTLHVSEYLCLGCGYCAEVCPRNAIILQEGKARIMQSRCNQCGVCIAVCPSGAIEQCVPVPTGDLKAEIELLQAKTDELLEKIENCLRKSSARK